MTTKVAYILTGLLVLSQIPLSGEVFAQEEETTSEVENPVEEQIEERWFKSDFVTGNIEIGDFVVGPGRTEIELAPGESKTFFISVTNRISGDREFKLETEDIGGTDDGRSLVSLAGEERGPYSIIDYVSYPSDTFDLDLGERGRIPITISVPADAEPGGHYGSVLVSTVRKSEGNSESPVAPVTPIIARIGSLIFLTVSGEVERSGHAVEVVSYNDGKWWYEKGPIEMGISYENTGSVHLNPYGEVSVRNMLGEEVGFMQLEPWFVLPKSLRTRDLTWDREFLFGRYTVEARINRGYDDVVDTVSTSFWVLPWKIVGGTFVVLFIIIFGVRAFFRTFEFKRKGD